MAPRSAGYTGTSAARPLGAPQANRASGLAQPQPDSREGCSRHGSQPIESFRIRCLAAIKAASHGGDGGMPAADAAGQVAVADQARENAERLRDLYRRLILSYAIERVVVALILVASFGALFIADADDVPYACTLLAIAIAATHLLWREGLYRREIEHLRGLMDRAFSAGRGAGGLRSDLRPSGASPTGVDLPRGEPLIPAQLALTDTREVDVAGMKHPPADLAVFLFLLVAILIYSRLFLFLGVSV